MPVLQQKGDAVKINRRSVPLDILSVDGDGYHVYVGTDGKSHIQIVIMKDGREVYMQPMTFQQFVSLLMRDAQP